MLKIVLCYIQNICSAVCSRPLRLYCIKFSLLSGTLARQQGGQGAVMAGWVAAGSLTDQVCQRSVAGWSSLHALMAELNGRLSMLLMWRHGTVAALCRGMPECGQQTRTNRHRTEQCLTGSMRIRCSHSLTSTFYLHRIASVVHSWTHCCLVAKHYTLLHSRTFIARLLLLLLLLLVVLHDVINCLYWHCQQQPTYRCWHRQRCCADNASRGVSVDFR